MNTFNDISTAVGRQFVKVYYQTLYSDPRALYKLYNPEAIRTKASLHKDEHSESWVGLKEIKESFEKKGSGYKNVQIIGAHSQPSYAGSILVTVSGTLMEDEDTAFESINFVQVFVLAAQGQSWAVQNDVLRFDAIHQKEENAKESENSTENTRDLAAVAEEVNETQENNEKPAENEENTREVAAVQTETVENTAEESSKEIPDQTAAVSSENKEENAAASTNNEAASESQEKKEETTKKEEEQTQNAQPAGQTAPQGETEQQATPPQNKKSKFNGKKFENKSSPKSKWGRQNSQQNNKSVPPSAASSSPSAPPASSAPTTPSYADIAKKIAAAGSLNPSPAPSTAPPSASLPASPASADAPSSENQSTVPSSDPVTHKEQTKTQQQGKREYKDSPNPFRKDAPPAGLNKTVVARNLPNSATKENLKTIFEEFGSVSNVHIVANSPLAFIEFSDPSTAQTVLLRAKTSPILVDGKEIKVEPKKKRAAGSGGKERNSSNGGNVNNNNNSNRKKEYRVRGNNDSSNRGNN